METKEKLDTDIDRIAEALVQFGGGDLEARAPNTGEGSSVDRLAFVVNLTIGELAALFRESQQQVAALEARQAALEATNRDLVETQERLRHLGKLAALGELSAMIAHELSQPLSVIAGYASHVLEQGRSPLEPDTQTYIEKIFSCSMQMGKTLENLTRFSRKDSVDTRPTDPVEPVEATRRMLEHHLQRLGIELHVRAAEDLPQALMDSSLAQQVLLNLLSNARDALTLLPPGAPRKIEVAIQASPEDVRYRIRDSGPGVPDEDRERIFEPFFTTKEPAAGTGLGLALSRDLAKQMGGALELLSGEGGGCFVLSLPRSPGA